MEREEAWGTQEKRLSELKNCVELMKKKSLINGTLVLVG